MILSNVSHHRKNIIFYEKKFKTRKIMLLIMFFVTELSLTIASYQLIKNDCILIDLGLFFQEKYCLQLYSFKF